METKKMDFLVEDQPVKARIYNDGPSAFVELSGLNLNVPMDYARVDALRTLFDDLLFQMHFAQQKLDAMNE